MQRTLLAVSLTLASGIALGQDAAALGARHVELRGQLAHNPFGRPLHVESSADGGEHKGQIYAVLEEPFSAVGPALARAANWCDILTLQINIKGCAANDGTLTAFVTRKPRDPLESAHRVDFRIEPGAVSPDYLRVALSAGAGPMGTRDYRIRLEATPLDGERTFMHLSYAYSLGFAARVAMDAYLAGAGREKRGFSVEGGERGVVERSAMRHYLAIEAFLESKDLESRLRHWYAATARYPQLREQVGADEYVEMKRREAG
jgi:hypothetical protein